MALLIFACGPLKLATIVQCSLHLPRGESPAVGVLGPLNLSDGLLA